jgi:hypothetical protein
MSAHTNQRPPRIKVTVTLVTLAGVALLLAHSVLAQRTVGFVLNLEGEWVVDNSPPLKPGSPLHVGERIRSRSRSENDFIEIADARGRVIINRNCREYDCRKPIDLPRDDSGILSRVLEAGMVLIYDSPTKFAVLVSRGGELREAVVKVSGEQADMTSVLTNRSPGKYFLRFVPKSGAAAGDESKQLGPVGIDWDARKPLLVSVKGLTPGLYEVQLLDGQDKEPEGPGTEAWVLFVRPERFAEALRSFREAEALANGWGDSVRMSSKRQFLRAFLGHLDSEDGDGLP